MDLIVNNKCIKGSKNDGNCKNVGFYQNVEYHDCQMYTDTGAPKSFRNLKDQPKFYSPQLTEVNLTVPGKKEKNKR